MDKAMMEIIHSNCRKTRMEKNYQRQIAALNRQKDVLEVLSGIGVWSLLIIMLIEIFG